MKKKYKHINNIQILKYPILHTKLSNVNDIIENFNFKFGAISFDNTLYYLNN